MDRVAHVQFADMPDRKHPSTGSVDWAQVVATLKAGGYRGAIGLECFPGTPGDAWVAPARRAIGL
jgi:hydroxypyruvate isomerase